MMKNNLLITALISLFLSTGALSQLGIKGGFAATTLIEKKAKGIPIGFDAGLTYDITQSIRTEILVEGIYFSPFEGLKFSSYPITAGAEYRFFKGTFRPFAGMNLGMMHYRNNFKDENLITSQTSFTIHPKIGFDIEITEHLFIDLTLKYHVIFHKNWGELYTEGITGANIGLIYVF